MATIYSRKSLDLANKYYDLVNTATERLLSRWETQGFYMTFSQTAVYPLYFRNSSIWASLSVLFREDKYIGAEFLIRPLFEGVTKFDWCMLDLESRAWRFRLTSMESTVEYFNSRNSDCSKERANELVEAITCLKEKGYKRIPPTKQMCEELVEIHGDKWHSFYKYFSKIVHAEFEIWDSYDTASSRLGKEAQAGIIVEQSINCKSLATYLQMRNIILLGMLFEPMKYDDISRLEEVWSLLFYSLLDDELQGTP